MRMPKEFVNEDPENGAYQGLCIGMIDLGVQPDDFHPGQTQDKIGVQFELDSRDSKGSRFILTKEFNYIWGTTGKGFRGFMESWIGKKLPDKVEELPENFFEKFDGKAARIRVFDSASGKYKIIKEIEPPDSSWTKITRETPEGFIHPFFKDKVENGFSGKSYQESGDKKTEEKKSFTDDDIPF